MNSLFSRGFTILMIILIAIAAIAAFRPNLLASNITSTPSPRRSVTTMPTLNSTPQPLPASQVSTVVYSSLPQPPQKAMPSSHPTAVPSSPLTQTNGLSSSKALGPLPSSVRLSTEATAQPYIAPPPVSTLRSSYYSPSPTSVVVTPAPTPLQLKTVHYLIDTGAQTIRGDIATADQNVGQIMLMIAQDRGISFHYQTTHMGWFVTEIASVQNNPTTSQYWVYYINGVFADKSVDQMILHPGDELVWRYSKG